MIVRVGLRYLLLFLLAMLVVGCRPSKPSPELTDYPLPQETPEASESGQPLATTNPPRGTYTLRDYWLRAKYPAEEQQAVGNLVGDLLGYYTPAGQRQAEAEILAFHHVVFNLTRWHDLRRNHALIRKFEPKLKELCELHDVPFLPVLGIVSWENSGDVNKVSWADAAGLGQMTWGAVEEAHNYSAQRSRQLLEEARWKKYMAAVTADPKAMREARALAEKAARLDIRQRHHRMAKEAKVNDERQLVECNLEDVVVFYEYLLSKYGGRVDHGIAAYHKGVTNQDDIIYDYLKRKEPNLPYPEPNNRDLFIAAIERHDVTYLTLWNDSRSREMLNGLRTVEGEPTTPYNASMALGDESDIYPWKVMGSLSAYRAGPDHLERMVKRYNGNQSEIETEGLPEYTSQAALEEGIRKNLLTFATAPISDVGYSGGGGSRYSACITRELDGYLWGLTNRMRANTGRNDLRLPVSALHEASGKRAKLHSRGVAAVIDGRYLQPEERTALSRLLKRDYLGDRVYWTSLPDGQDAICLNPRYGNEFLDLRSKADPKSPGSGQPVDGPL